MNHQKTINWWKEKAPTYFTDKSYGFSQPALIERLNIQPESYVLEIGFGYGRELSQFCNLSKHVYGVELSDWTLDLARRELLNQDTAHLPRLLTYDGQHLPFAADTFSVVYSCYLLQHMSRESAKSLLAEALRITAVRGQVLMEFFGHPAYQHDTEDRFSGDPDNGGMYNNGYTLSGVKELLTSLGDVQWIEPQSVFAEGEHFNNWWGCCSPDGD